MQIVKLRLELFNKYKTDKDLAPNVQKWSTIVQFQFNAMMKVFWIAERLEDHVNVKYAE